jgi:hypothetical protein
MQAGREIHRARARAGENERKKEKGCEREGGRKGGREGGRKGGREGGRESVRERVWGVQGGGGNERGDGMTKRQGEREEREEARPLA